MSYNEGTCTTNTNCAISLVCKSSTSSSCSCPTTISIGKCDCPEPFSGAEYYWNGTHCVNGNSLNQPCTANYQCQTLTQSTTCSGLKCSCLSTLYFNNVNNKCETLLIINNTCTQSDACNSGKGLSCTSMICQCNSTQFWKSNTDGCVNYYGYNAGTCSADNQCLSNLVCKTSGSSCSCPTNIMNGNCDCPVRVSGNEKYWNGSFCAPALNKSKSCTADYMCQTLTQKTTCISGTCACLSTEYFSNINNICETLLIINNTCTQSDACNSGKGLSCTSTICLCSSTQFWKSSTDGCVNYYSYNAGTCTADNECNNAKTNLVCRTSGTSCKCPTTVSNGRCDCQTRAYGNEKYWNGTHCNLAGSHGASCTINYQCQELTASLTCDIVSKTCVCSSGLWNSTNNVCVPCASGWKYYNDTCFNGFYLSVPSFQDLTIAAMKTICSNSVSTNVELALSSDFSSSDVSWLDSNICTNPSVSHTYYFGPVNSIYCPTYDCTTTGFSTHSCSHGQSNHAIICKYT